MVRRLLKAMPTDERDQQLREGYSIKHGQGLDAGQETKRSKRERKGTERSYYRVGEDA